MHKSNDKNRKKKINPPQPPASQLTPTWRIDLPLDYPCQIYPRVSTPEQRKNVSAEMQKDKSFALSCGWREDQIILDDRDLGVSGQELMEDREAFKTMLRRIAAADGLNTDAVDTALAAEDIIDEELTVRPIKAVVVVNVDRLFRDKWGAESGKFMEICHMYGVIIVTPDFVYDFRIGWHIERFKRRCEEAWNYMEYHIYGRLLPARDQRGFRGFWTGGSIAMGFVLDTREKINGVRNPDHYRYVVYEPHAEVIRWLFRRFRELNGNIPLLMGEIRKRPFLFPDFDDTISPFLIQAAYSQYIKLEKGYTITSAVGLRRLLTNRVYIGCWIYKHEVIDLGDYPTPIVDLDTFTYAYNRLSKTQLDGTPNEAVIEGKKVYAKKHFADRPAILKEVIVSADPNVSIYAQDMRTHQGIVRSCYSFRIRRKGTAEERPVMCMLVAAELDAVVLERLREHMRQPETAAVFQDFTVVEDEVITEASETLKDIERDIAATKALIARIKAQVESGKLVDPDLAEAANNSYVAAKQDLQRLEQRKADTTKIANEDEERRTYKKLMRDVEDAWEEVVMPEEHPRLVHLFVKSVTVDTVSSGFFTITIAWRDPAWQVDHGLCYKGAAAHVPWTDEEKALAVQHWSTAARRELLGLLPRRSFVAIRTQISSYNRSTGLSIRRPKRPETGVPYSVCLDDWNIMEQHGITEADVLTWGKIKLVRWY